MDILIDNVISIIGNLAMEGTKSINNIAAKSKAEQHAADDEHEVIDMVDSEDGSGNAHQVTKADTHEASKAARRIDPRRLRESSAETAEQVIERLGIDKSLVDRASEAIRLRRILDGVLYEDEDEFDDMLVLVDERMDERFNASKASHAVSKRSFDKLISRVKRLEDEVSSLKESNERLMVNAAANDHINQPDMTQSMDKLEAKMDGMVTT